MRKWIGLGLILASSGLFFLFSSLGLAPYLRFTLLTFGVGAGIFMIVADGIISAFQGQDLAGLDQYLKEDEENLEEPIKDHDENLEEPINDYEKDTD